MGNLGKSLMSCFLRHSIYAITVYAIIALFTTRTLAAQSQRSTISATWSITTIHSIYIREFSAVAWNLLLKILMILQKL